MKRALLLLLAAPLLSACASSHASGSSEIDYGPHIQRSSVTPIAVRRERRAGRDAEALMRRVPVPLGSVRLWHQPPGDANDLSHSGLGVSIVEMTADRYSYWQLPGSGEALLAFEKRHILPGLHEVGGGSSQTARFAEFDGPSVGGRPMQREVSLTIVPLAGRTILRIDAGVSWIYPRSPSEVVPSGVTQIGIRNFALARRVTDPGEVARIIRWFNGLNVDQPGPFVNCFAVADSNVSFVFRSKSGKRLATANAPSVPATGCDTIRFSIGGKRQISLIDARSGRYAFINRVERLLGVHFRRR